MKIDTIQQQTGETILDENKLEELKKESGIMYGSDKTLQCNFGMKIAYKPSNFVNKGKELIPCKDSLKIVNDINIKYGLNDDISTVRIDFSIDYIESILNRKEHKRFKLLLECLRLKRKWEKDIFVLEENGYYKNIKISSKHMRTTAYRCDDLYREKNGHKVSTRLENRYLLQGIDKTKDIKQLTLDKLNKMLLEFQDLESYVELVEDIIAKELAENYKKNKGISYKDFSSFLEVQDNNNLILGSIQDFRQKR